MSRRGCSLFAGSMAMLAAAALRKWIPLHNVAFYIVCCIVFFCVAMAAYIILKEDKKRPGVQAVSTALLVIWIIWFGVGEVTPTGPVEEEVLIRRIFPFPVWILLMAAGVAASLFLMRKKPNEQTAAIRKKIRAAVTVLFTIGTSVQFYAPNILEDVQGNAFHSHAYNGSIINAAWMIPYSYRNASNYGHYGILFMPFLRVFHKFFGLDYITSISLICAVLQGISILIFAYVLNWFIRQDAIYYLALLGIGEYYFMQLKGGVYYQVHPHRMIFPMIMLLLVMQENVRKKYYNVLAVIGITLSIVWSTEVGIVIMMAYALYRWMDQTYDGQGFALRKCLELFKKLALFALVPFAAAYVLVNLYNLLAGGAWLNFTDYMFPLITEGGYLAHLELEMPGIFHAWIGIAALFLGAVVTSMIPVLFPGKERQEEHPVVFFMGVMALGIMIYYINRPVDGCLFVNIYVILILMAIVLQKAQDIYLAYRQDRQSLRTGENVFTFLSLRVIVTFFLFVMAFDCVYSMPDAWKTSGETIWKRNELMEFAKHIEVQVPPDAYSFGIGVPEILSMVDRDTHVHCSAWIINDLTDDVVKEVRYELEGKKWIFCNLSSLYEMQLKFPGLSDQYEINEVMKYHDYEFGYFVRKEE